MMWKSNWDDTKRHYTNWWQHKGGILTTSVVHPPNVQHEEVARPPEFESIKARYTAADLRAKWNHYSLSRMNYPADNLPISDADIGPGSLALFCGCEPEFTETTVWYKPCIHEVSDPETLPTIRFDASNGWWRTIEATLKACSELARDKYLVGCPDLIENIDILAAMRDPQTLMMDMIERPAWVEEKIHEIDAMWIEAYQRIYDIIKLEDGSSAFHAFSLWGPGKTAKIQCDASAMFSPEMFRRFILPSLKKQCAWLDYSMYHLDGTQAICHLDALLEIEELDAIQWTPQSGIEPSGNPQWFDMYRRIVEAGKSVQVGRIAKENIPLLLDTIGSNCVKVDVLCSDIGELEAVMSMSAVERLML